MQDFMIHGTDYEDKSPKTPEHVPSRILNVS